MLDSAKQLVWQLVTEPNNKTACPVRLMAIAGFAQYLGVSCWHVYHTGAFDPQAHALGLAALLAGIGAALGLKKDSGDK